ncbi:hypothetical protein RHGRI_036952 [Rhododendron griersonianum]|uniref:Uncharacterized protein n=1 Tax=Rhododendron griersonianum TaxID=479676 RepID=A0AAV6HTQ7_9ERIC|nr:hypothetical protein RHGRI_036952 [Rhododendron griersonianum]KAG5516072.1 hypothetical protein RHGRI_036952 [Rhododendron griersonianum]
MRRSPRLASPRLASPRLASPRLASPRLASPRLASPPTRTLSPRKSKMVERASECTNGWTTSRLLWKLVNRPCSDAYCKLAEQRRWPALFPGGGSGGVNLVLNGMNIVIVLTSPQTTGISMLIMEGRLELRSSEMKKVFATWRALVEVMEALSKDAAPDGVGRLFVEEVSKKDKKKSDAPLAGELTPYNIVPLEAPSLTNAIGFFPEVRGAISALRYSENFRFPAGFELLALRDVDMFDLLEYVFGFQVA